MLLVFVCFISLLSAFVFYWQLDRVGLVLYDFSYITETAFRIHLGEKMYKDFISPYMPLVFLLKALLIKTGNLYLSIILACGFLNIFSILLTYYIARLYLSSRYVIILLIPLIFLGITNIYPNLSYDNIVSFSVLLSIAAFVYAKDKGQGERGYIYLIISGFVSLIPILGKQNVGLAYSMIFFISNLIMFFINIRKQQERKIFAFCLMGILLGIICFGSIFHAMSGLDNMFYNVITLAARSRLHVLDALNGWLSDFKQLSLQSFLFLFIIARLILKFLKNRLLVIITNSIIFYLPFIFLIFFGAWELLWPFLSGISVLYLIESLFIPSKKEISEKLNVKFFVLLLVITTIYSATFSQGFHGSSYAIWPFFIILVCFTFSKIYPIFAYKITNPALTVTCILTSILLSIFGADYIFKNKRLSYVKISEPKTRIITGHLKGFKMHTEHKKSFDSLIKFIKHQTKPDDGIVALHGEDPIFIHLNRKPLFPTTHFDISTSPFSFGQFLSLVNERNINFIFLKKHLHLNHEIPSNMSFDKVYNLKEFYLYKSIGFYDVLKRRNR